MFGSPLFGSALFGSQFARVTLPVAFTPPDGRPHPRSSYPYDKAVLCVEILQNRLYVVSKTTVSHVAPGTIIMVDDAMTAQWQSGSPTRGEDQDPHAHDLRVNLYEDGLLSLENGLLAVDEVKYPFVLACRKAVAEVRGSLLRDAGVTRVMIEDLRDNGLVPHGDEELTRLTTAAKAMRDAQFRPFSLAFSSASLLVDRAVEIIRTGSARIDQAYEHLNSARATLRLPQLQHQLSRLTFLASQWRHHNESVADDRVRVAFHQIHDLVQDLDHLRQPLLLHADSKYREEFEGALMRLTAAAKCVNPYRDEKNPDDMREAYQALTQAGRKLAGLA